VYNPITIKKGRLDMSEKEAEKHFVTTANMNDILSQPIGLEEVFVRVDGKATAERRNKVCVLRALAHGAQNSNGG